MFGIFSNLPKGERSYRLRAGWVATKLDAKRKHITRLAEADYDFREKLISNPEAALLYAGVDTKGISVDVSYRKTFLKGFQRVVMLELEFYLRNHETDRERRRSNSPLGSGPWNLQIILPRDIKLPKITSSESYNIIKSKN